MEDMFDDMHFTSEEEETPHPLLMSSMKSRGPLAKLSGKARASSVAGSVASSVAASVTSSASRSTRAASGSESRHNYELVRQETASEMQESPHKRRRCSISADDRLEAALRGEDGRPGPPAQIAPDAGTPRSSSSAADSSRPQFSAETIQQPVVAPDFQSPARHSAVAEPSSGMPQCGVCGRSAHETAWCHEASLGGHIRELVNACGDCVSGAQVVCPTLPWPDTCRLATSSPDFRVCIPTAGKIQKALAPLMRSSQQIMSLMGQKPSETTAQRTVHEALTKALGCESIDSSAGLPSSGPAPPRPGRAAPKRETPSKRTATGRRTKDSSVIAISADGKGNTTEDCDKHSYAYHAKKLVFADILTNQVQKIGNLLNAVENSANQLLQEPSGLRTTEGQNLHKLHLWGCAADLVSVKQQQALSHEAFRKNIAILGEAKLKAYPEPFCSIVLRRSAMQAEGGQEFVLMVAIWAPCRDFDISKPQIASIPGSTERIVALFDECLVTDLLADALRSQEQQPGGKMDRLRVIAVRLYPAFTSASAQVRDRYGMDTMRRIKQSVEDVCAVASIIRGDTEIGMPTREVLATLRDLRVQARHVSPAGQPALPRQQVGEALTRAPWDAITDEFLAAVVRETDNLARRDVLAQKLRDHTATREDIAAVAESLRAWHKVTRPGWRQPLEWALYDFGTYFATEAWQGRLAAEARLAAVALRTLWDLLQAEIVFLDREDRTLGHVERSLKQMEPLATKLEEEQQERDYIDSINDLMTKLRAGTLTKSDLDKVQTAVPKWNAQQPAGARAACEQLVGSLLAASVATVAQRAGLPSASSAAATDDNKEQDDQKKDEESEQRTDEKADAEKADEADEEKNDMDAEEAATEKADEADEIKKDLEVVEAAAEKADEADEEKNDQKAEEADTEKAEKADTKEADEAEPKSASTAQAKSYILWEVSSEDVLDFARMLMSDCDRKDVSSAILIVKLAAEALATERMLSESTTETNNKKRSLLVKNAVKDLGESRKKNLTREAAKLLSPILSQLSLHAEIIAAADELVEAAITRRDAILAQHAMARSKQAHMQMVTCTADLTQLCRGGEKGKAWADEKDDWPTLVAKTEFLFANFDATKVDGLAQKATRAMHTYSREAMEAAYTAQKIASEIKATEEAVQQAMKTMNEATPCVAVATRVGHYHGSVVIAVIHITNRAVIHADSASRLRAFTVVCSSLSPLSVLQSDSQAYLMAAVLTGGSEGREQCRQRLDAMLEKDGEALPVHETLLEQVYKLLGR